jgi:hypothetical protein
MSVSLISLQIQTPPGPETCHSETDHFSFDLVSVWSETQYGLSQQTHSVLALPKSLNPKEYDRAR